MTALLDVRGIGKRFGGLQAVADVSFTLNEGEILGTDWPERRRQNHALQSGEWSF